jgi:hypothetical protein
MQTAAFDAEVHHAFINQLRRKAVSKSCRPRKMPGPGTARCHRRDSQISLDRLANGITDGVLFGLEDLVASATEQCAPVLVKVRRRLTTSDRRETKIALQLGSCLDRLPHNETVA